jgi:hypothetical protein
MLNIVTHFESLRWFYLFDIFFIRLDLEVIQHETLCVCIIEQQQQILSKFLKAFLRKYACNQQQV